MKTLKISEEEKNYLSKRINDLISRLVKKDSVECIYVSSFDVLNLFNDVYIGLDLVFDDKDYYSPMSEAIVTFAELYTSVITRKLYKKGLRISFNIKSSKRSDYLKDKSILLDYLYRSDIIYDKFRIYTKIKQESENNHEEFSNTVCFEPKLELKKI